MFNKINLVGAVILILLGLLLAIGYPKDGVKNNTQTVNNDKESYIPNLTREGNAKNFGVNINDGSKINNTLETKDIIHKSTSSAHKVEQTSHKVIQKVKKPVKKITHKPIKRKIKLATPPPPKEEEDDEGC